MIVTDWLHAIWRWLRGESTRNADYTRFEDTNELIKYLDQTTHPASETIIIPMTSNQIEARIKGEATNGTRLH